LLTSLAFGSLRAATPTTLGSRQAGGKSSRTRMTACFLFAGRDLVCERVCFDTASIQRRLAP
jgi:hypothetical protein